MVQLNSKYVIVIIITSHLISFNSGKIRLISSNLSIQISKCVTEISSRYFPVGRYITTGFIKNNHTMNIFDNLFSQQKWTIFIKIPTKEIYHSEDLAVTDIYIIYFRDEQEFYEILMYLKSFLKWNPAAKFIVTSSTVFENPHEVAINLTSTLWSFRVAHYVIMLAKSSELQLLDIYTWHPYTNGHCGDKFNDTKVVNQCKNGVLENDTNLFPDQMLTDLTGCTINAEVTKTIPFVILPTDMGTNVTDLNLKDGISIVVLETIAKATNFKVNYTTSVKEHDYGIAIGNGSTLVITGIIDSLVNNRVDIGIGFLPITSIRYRYLTLTNPYIMDYFTYIVPLANLEPKWKCLFKIFQMATWLLILLTLMLVALCFWTLANYSAREKTVYKKVSASISNAFAVLLGVSVRQPGSGTSRLLFLIWVIFCLHLTIAFETSLVSVLTRPSYEKQITTVEEIFEQEMSIGFPTPILQYFNNDNDWRAKKITKEWIECFGLPCLKKVIFERNFVLISSRLFVKYSEQQFLNNNGQSLTYLFKRNVANVNVVIALSRGFPLLHRMNVLLGRMKETGLVNLWIKNIWRTQYNTGNISEIHSRLSLFNVQAAFIILGFGLSFSVVAFALEIIVYKSLFRRLTRTA